MLKLQNGQKTLLNFCLICLYDFLTKGVLYLKNNKILSIFLVFVLLLNTFPIVSFAEEPSSLTVSDFNSLLGEMINEHDETYMSSSSYYALPPNRLIVKTNSNEVLAENYGAIDSVEGYKGIHIFQYSSQKKTDAAYAAFLEDEIEYVEYDFYIELGELTDDISGITDTTTTSYWNSEAAQVSQAYQLIDDYGIECSEVKVGIIDSGIYAEHSAFEEDRIFDSGFAIEDEDGVTYPSMIDDLNHGTHVAGIIYRNTMSNVKIYPYRVFVLLPMASYSFIYAAFELAVSQGMDIINMSLGGDYKENNSDCITLNQAIVDATNNNVVVVVAAGNEMGNADDNCPANCSSAITVAATDSRNLPDISYSASGNCVDVAAPGTKVLSTVPRYWNWYENDVDKGQIYDPNPQSLEKEMSGTSMATPHVTAAAAMLKSIRPDLSAMEIQNTLKRTATIPEGWSEYCGEKYYGVGIVNFYSIVCSAIRLNPEIVLNSNDKFEILPTAGSDSTYYTLDGTDPTPENGLVYLSPLDLSNKTVSFIKAASYRNGEQTGETVIYKMFRYETIKMNYKETKHPISSTYTKKIRWKSSDPNIATVDSEGNIKGVNVGETQVTAKLGSGKRIIYNVKVEYSKLQWFIMIFLCGFLWY